MSDDPFYVPLEFHRHIIQKNATEGGLIVVARGLGLNRIIRSFIHLYADSRVLVYVLNSEQDDSMLGFSDGSEQGQGMVFETAARIHVIKTETSAKERSLIYDKGGVVILSPRVFLMDLLHGRVPVPLVTGVMVPNAHRVAEYGMEAFCLYLLRLSNSVAFIKAFSDNPEFFMRGFAKAEKILKTLRCSNLVLYPRFHLEVNNELSHSNLELVEIKISPYQRMRMIQMSILSILESSIGDVCKDNSLNTDDFNVDLSVLYEFDSMIQQHLESNWHRVGFKTKQLLKEIKTLREILNYSLEYDSISFFHYLNLQVEDAHGLSYQSSAYWLLSDSANILVEVAKERAIAAEPNPKWCILLNIVEECELYRISKESKKPILILTESSNSIVGLAAILSLGVKEYLGRLSKVLIHQDSESKRLKADDAASTISTIKDLFDTEKYFDELMKRNIILRTSDSVDLEALQIANPAAIVMYSPNLRCLREIEVYKTICPSEENLKLYFMFYLDSVEEQRYLSAVRREKEAFEHLIKTKAVMAPYHEEAHIRAEFLIEDVLLRSGAQSNLRDDNTFAKKIVVDTRDLRSSLPFLLHLYGFDIEPRTIEVGDYILTPSICIERKSVPDLISSLNTGRLHNQLKAMSRSYATSVLLIEFDPDKPFYLLQSRSASALKRTDLSPTDLISKLSLLLIHHPKLKLLWTSSPRLTCDVFYDLKRNEPDPICVEDSDSSDSLPYNPKLKLPGVNNMNYYLLMRSVKNLKELASMTLPQLTEIIGIENGTKLYNYFDTELK